MFYYFPVVRPTVEALAFLFGSPFLGITWQPRAFGDCDLDDRRLSTIAGFRLSIRVSSRFRMAPALQAAGQWASGATVPSNRSAIGNRSIWHSIQVLAEWCRFMMEPILLTLSSSRVATILRGYSTSAGTDPIV